MGLAPTGRTYREPAATHVEHEDERGIRHTVIQFDAPYVGGALTQSVELVRSFLGYPMVVGLLELTHADPAAGRFAYPTGEHWTLHELIRKHADLSRAMGLRAALEVAWLAGQIVVEAAENGAVQGCFSHASLTPWRIALRPEGDLVLFGHGLPQIDVLAHARDPSSPLHADSVRYAPPERLTGAAEDVSADTGALVAIAYELATGQPLYAGHDAAALAKSVSVAEAATWLSRPNDALPRAVAHVFARSLVYDPDSRLTGAAWVGEIGALLEQFPQGDGLLAVAQRVAGIAPTPRQVARRVLTSTMAMTPEQVRAAAAAFDEDDDDAPAPAERVETRWSRPVRRASPEAAPEPSAPADADEGLVRRRRRRDEGAAPVVPAPVEVASDPGADDDLARSGDRPRRLTDLSADAPPGRRRRRRPEDGGDG